MVKINEKNKNRKKSPINNILKLIVLLSVRPCSKARLAHNNILKFEH